MFTVTHNFNVKTDKPGKQTGVNQPLVPEGERWTRTLPIVGYGKMMTMESPTPGKEVDGSSSWIQVDQ